MLMLPEFKSFLTTLKYEFKTYRLILTDSRTPVMAKVLLGAAVAYFVYPIDLIPDFIPVLGQLDDLAIVYGLVKMALRLIPKEVVDDCRELAKL
jgi:uncharacterized membrane protein YkvA (DUF1232 family)